MRTMTFLGSSFHGLTSLRTHAFPISTSIYFLSAPYRLSADFLNAEVDAFKETSAPNLALFQNMEIVENCDEMHRALFQNMEIDENCGEMKRETELNHVTDLRY